MLRKYVKAHCNYTASIGRGLPSRLSPVIPALPPSSPRSPPVIPAMAGTHGPDLFGKSRTVDQRTPFSSSNMALIRESDTFLARALTCPKTSSRDPERSRASTSSFFPQCLTMYDPLSASPCA